MNDTNGGPPPKDGTNGGAPPNRHGRHAKSRIKLWVDPHQEVRLRELSEKYGYTMTSLIRCCVDLQLSELESKLKSQEVRHA